MSLPFTPDQFFQVFATYHERFWPIALGLWLVTALATAAAVSRPERFGRLLSWVLGILWLWNGVAYHALLFTAINPMAWGFAALFLIQVALFLTAGRHVEFFSARGPMRTAGVALVVYGFAYPFLNFAFGHPYPATPTFGVPCPTTVVTIGLLLTVRGGPPLALSIVPALWGLVGGSAAVVLAVWTDYVLLAAGLTLSAILIARAVTDAGGLSR